MHSTTAMKDNHGLRNSGMKKRLLWITLYEKAKKAQEEKDVILLEKYFTQGLGITKKWLEDKNLKSEEETQATIDFLTAYHFIDDLYTTHNHPEKAKLVHQDVISFLDELQNSPTTNKNKQDNIEYCLNLIGRDYTENPTPVTDTLIDAPDSNDRNDVPADIYYLNFRNTSFSETPDNKEEKIEQTAIKQFEPRQSQ